jgi:hypothetical protein
MGAKVGRWFLGVGPARAFPNGEAIAAKPANRAKGETGPAAMNAIHSYLSASTKDQDDTLIAGYARATAGDLLAACNRMIQCLAGFDTVFLMSPKGASEQASQIDDEWFKGFNRTHETLCLAASARKMDVAPYKRLTNCAYAFWKGAADPKSTETEWKLLFPPGIEVLHNLKRALMVEMAKADAESQAAFAKGAQLGAGAVGVKFTPQNTRMTKDEANIKARDFLRQHPNATLRELAAGVGCSTGLVSKLPAWKAVKEQRDKGRQPKKAGNIALTPKMEQVVGVEGDALAKLIGEQEADAEPSPLVNDAAGDRTGAPRRAKIYRKP